MMTSFRESSARVAAWRMRSIASLMMASLSMYVSDVGTYARAGSSVVADEVLTAFSKHFIRELGGHVCSARSRHLPA